MAHFKKFQLLTLLFLSILFLFNCKSDKKNNKNNAILKVEKNNKNVGQKLKININKVPSKALIFCDLIKNKNFPKNEYVGGRKFKNLERNLPIKDSFGNKITYYEWDINKKIKGKNRGKERLVTGSDGTCYYTKNHYKSFILVTK